MAAVTQQRNERERAELRANVAVMRELGVLVWNGITLGPEPRTYTAEPEAQKDPQAQKRSYYENLLDRSFTQEDLEKLP